MDFKDFYMKKLLSIITPFYCSNESSYLNDRIDLYINNSFNPDWIERIIVDFGSPKKIAKRVEQLCHEKSFKYINLDKGRERFSAGKCRNIGAQIALGEYLSFSDVDLFADEKFYDSVFLKISKDNVFNYFEVLPCFYLTESGSEKYLNSEIQHEDIYSYYMEGDQDVIKMAAPATSCFLIKKDFYLSEGGMREDFFGHGYEDFELMNRLAVKSNKFFRSHDYYSHDYKYDSLEYKGYRTFFSLFGRENLNKGIYYVHIYHEPAKDPGYKESSRRNRKIFEDCMQSFDKRKDSPPALDNLTIKRNVLMLGWKNGIPFKGIREVLPLIGKTHYRTEADFSSDEDFLEYIANNNIDYVFFLNPYGNEERLHIYKICKSNGIKFIVYDRGALPDSWFFDVNGFNAESKSYSQEYWDVDLKEDEEFEVEKYISKLCTSDETLEVNGVRIGSYALKEKYGCLNKKVIFVPLQRPKDTVIKYFSGSVSGVEDFLERVKNLSASLPSDWVILIKQHPLESYPLDIPGCMVVNDNTHVYDLIEASDVVLLINSGVGLLSLCFDKPVLCLGKSFYVHDGLAKRISPEENIADYILNINSFKPDRVLVNKFIKYLVSDFYSFARTEYITVADGDSGASRSVATNLLFSKIKIPGLVDKKISRRWEMLSTKTPAYDFYRAYFQRSSESKNQVAVNHTEVPKNSVAEHKVVQPQKKIVVQKVVEDVNSLDTQKKGFVKNSDSQKYIKKDSSFKRKFKKLMRDPVLFFKDAVK